MNWEDSYIGKLRKAAPHQALIVPSVRAIFEDDEGKFLYIQRNDNGTWAMPAGSIELNESIYDCLVREVIEETGLKVISASPVAIYTSPNKAITNHFGDTYQLFEFLFFVEKWEGSLESITDETFDIKFFPLELLPIHGDDFWSKHHQEVIKDYIKYKEVRQFIVK